MQQWAMDGRETIALRGYKNQSLSSRDGSLLYNKFTLELRYPITLKPSASIFALSFLESGNGYNSFRDFNPFNSSALLVWEFEFLCLLSDCSVLILDMDLTAQTLIMTLLMVGKHILLLDNNFNM